MPVIAPIKTLINPAITSGQIVIRVIGIYPKSMIIDMLPLFIEFFKSFPTIVVTTHQAVNENPKKADRIFEKGAEVIVVPSLDGKCDLAVALDGLGDRGIAQLLVEGGREVIASFIKSHLADEARIYIAPKFLGPEGNIDIIETLNDITADLKHTSVTNLEGDTCIKGLFKDI